MPKSPYRRHGLAPQIWGEAVEIPSQASAYNGGTQRSFSLVLVPVSGTEPNAKETGNTVGSLSGAETNVVAPASDPVTTVVFSTKVAFSGQRPNPRTPQHADPSPLVGQGEDIVCAARESGSRAMSARRILGLEQVPRVGLFAH